MTRRPPPEIAIALDVPNREGVEALFARLGDEPAIVKVGLQLFIAEGPALVRDLVSSGNRVFLDLKLHDIPNTVARAVESARRLGVEWLTVHTVGGGAMLAAASRAAEGEVELLGVTVLTSMTPESLGATTGRTPLDVAEVARRRAAAAFAAGVRGMVCSVWEAPTLRAELGDAAFLVTPGIRLAEQSVDDQARVATPAKATEAGADMLVVGRAVRAAANPAQALQRIRQEIARAQA